MDIGLPLHVMRGQRQGSRILSGGDGYFYHLNNDRRGRRFAFLRCVRYGRLADFCSGSAKCVGGRLFHLSAHNHASNIHYSGVLVLRQAILNRVKSGDRTPNAEILHQEGQRFSFQVRAQLPILEIEGCLNKIRGDLRPPVPESLFLLGLRLTEPRYWHLTECFGNNSMFAGVCGSEADQTLSLVFICEDMRAFMSTRDLVFSDGTQRKKFRKPLNSQIFSIYGVWGSHGIPMLRAIMSRRTEAAYMALFDFIKFLMPQFQPSVIMSDFEDAEMNAWVRSFPNADVEGCLWHYAVATLTHAKVKLGLQPLVQAEEEVSSIIRACTALPLLPTQEIEDGLKDLGDEALQRGWMGNLRPFFRYMDREWIPKVPVLSVHDAAHRTNNIAETGNNSLNRLLKVSHPGCYTVVGAFVQLNEKALIELEAIRNNRRVVRARKISVLRNDRVIKQLTRERENGDIDRLEFLHRASRRMQNVFMKVMNLRQLHD